MEGKWFIYFKVYRYDCHTFYIHLYYLLWVETFTLFKNIEIHQLTIVRKMPNSGFIPTLSPSVKMKVFRRSFLQVSTVAICWAVTERTGRSIRLNSSKQPQDPDWARPNHAKINKKSQACKTQNLGYRHLLLCLNLNTILFGYLDKTKLETWCHYICVNSIYRFSTWNTDVWYL